MLFLSIVYPSGTTYSLVHYFCFRFLCRSSSEFCLQTLLLHPSSYRAGADRFNNVQRFTAGGCAGERGVVAVLGGERLELGFVCV